jgi:hypothetical protein
MDNFIIIENYNIHNKYIKYLEEYSYILFIQNSSILTIFFNEKNNNYCNYLKNTYNGKIKKCYVNNNNQLFTHILEIYDIYILEFLSSLYNNVIVYKKTNNKKIENKLYNDFIKLYNNQDLFIKNNDYIFL